MAKQYNRMDELSERLRRLQANIDAAESVLYNVPQPQSSSSSAALAAPSSQPPYNGSMYSNPREPSNDTEPDYHYEPIDLEDHSYNENAMQPQQQSHPPPQPPSSRQTQSHSQPSQQLSQPQQQHPQHHQNQNQNQGSRSDYDLPYHQYSSQQYAPRPPADSRYTLSVNTNHSNHEGGHDQNSSNAASFAASRSQAALMQNVPNSSQRKRSPVSGYADPDIKECTFKPQINPGLQFSMPFQERVKLWQMQRERERSRLQQELGEKEVEGCTFKPSINPATVSLVKEKQEHGENLALQALSRKVKIEEEIKRQKDEEFKKSCTFKPQIVESAMSKKIKSRYVSPYRPANPNKTAHDQGHGEKDEHAHVAKEIHFDTEASHPPRPVSALRMSRGPETIESDRQCTFTPRVNRPVGKHVVQYLEQPAFMRLSRPSSAPPKRADTPLSDDGKQGSDDGQGSQASDADSRKQSADFDAFIARQQAREQQRKDKLKYLQMSVEPSHQPSINRKSIELVQRSGNADFFRRQQRALSAARNAHPEESKENLSNGSNKSADEESFKPKINPKSQKMRPRSVDEMCYGDMLRRNAQLEAMKLEAEQRELDGVTFKPQLNTQARVAEQVQSKLKVMTDPDSYTQRVKEEQRLKQERAEALARERERKELENCTFAPEIHDAPDYVKRIARSMALAKGQRQNVSPPQRTWL